MSWLSIPLSNPFKTLQSDPSQSSESPSSPSSHGGAGVRDDLSVLGETIGRQLRGVAAFLAPPPSVATPPSSSGDAGEGSEPSSVSLLGIRNDLVEIGGSFRSGFSLLSANKAVTEISKLASNLLQIEEVGDDGEGDKDGPFDEFGVPGINGEVVRFVNELSLRPECWLDFPLSLNCDFYLSNAQKEHASAVLRLAPRFTALRRELCSRMSNSQFWMIYFILLLPKLDGRSLELLSTPKIVEARVALLQKLKNKNKVKVEGNQSPTSQDEEIEEHGTTEQLLERGAQNTSMPVGAQKQLETEEDVSFSDLEDDDDDVLSGRLGHNNRAPSPSGSSEWVQLNERTAQNSGREKVNRLISREKDSEDDSSNEWLTVDFDSDSSRAA